jgi:hypothetical protein
MVTPKQRCQACLRGIHDPNNCFLCGPAFCPTKLNQRINNYNQQFGDKPPKGRVPPEYKPLGLHAMHNKKSNLRDSSKPVKKPFSVSTKVKLNQQKSSIYAFEQTDHPSVDEPSNTEEEAHPYIGSFIQEETSFLHDHLPTSDDDLCDIEPNICLMSAPLPAAPPSMATTFTKPHYKTTNVYDMVHPDITKSIQKYHQVKGN